MIQPSPRFDGETRFRIALQKNRAVVYTIACTLGSIFHALGLFEVHYYDILIVLLIGDTTAAVAWWCYRAQLHRRFGLGIDSFWLAADMVAISYSVYLSGGWGSIFFPWYTVNIAAAAFSLGPVAAAVVALLDTASFIIVLTLLGQTSGFDARLFLAVSMMINLYAACFFFLRAVKDLQRKRAEVKVLREEERQRAEQLADANLRLIEADRTKSRFLANMSHELRTPLNSIIGFAEILLRQLEAKIEPKHFGFLGNIHASGKHLLTLISDILDLSKIEAGKMDLFPERISITSTAGDVCAIVMGMAREHHVAIEIETPEDLPEVEADPVRIKQILFNLLSNAVKFSPDGSTVRVVARHAPAGASPIGFNSVEIAVVDQGVGISPEDQAIVFEEFQQVTAKAARKAGGTGLGLTLVKRFVELHGGTITLQSALGEGSAFTVILPVEYRGQRAIEATVESAVAELDGCLILVVEDDPTAWNRIAEPLNEAGFRPTWCRDGAAAVALASRLAPAAVILDLILPGIDGFEVLKQLKEKPETRAIPVVIVSLLPTRDLGLALGAHDFFSKPLDPRPLLERIHELLPANSGSSPHVLLVDDDRALHQIVDETLEPEGYIVDHAFDGVQALELARSEKFDAVILDLMMDRMDGFEVAQTLEAEHGANAIPVIVFTAKDLTVREHEKLRDKIAGLVRKAEDGPARLVAVLRDVLRRPRRSSSRADAQ